MPEQLDSESGNGFSREQLESITTVAAPADGHSPTALPDLPTIEKPQFLNLTADSVGKGLNAPSSEGLKPSSYTEAKDKLTLEYQGLSATEISDRIDKDFFDTARLNYSTDRNKETVVNGTALDLKLFKHARHLQDISTEHVKTLGAEKEQRARVLKQAARDQKKAAEDARQKIEHALGDGKISIDLFKEARSIEEIDKLTGFWAEKGYISATEGEQGEISYQTPKSAQFDKGKLVAGNSILDLRQEALERVSKMPGAPSDSSDPVAPDNEPRTVFEDLLKLEPYDAQRPGDSIASRLAVLGKAYEEAGNDSDELELVIGQAFRQGLLVREYAKDPETGQVLRPVVKALSPEVDKWYGEANAHYQEVISHSDKEQEDAEQETFFPYSSKSADWIKSRIAMFKRRS